MADKKHPARKKNEKKGRPSKNTVPASHPVKLDIQAPGREKHKKLPMKTAPSEVIRDHEGGALSIFGVMQDMTGRKRIEAEVQITESKFSAIFNLIPDPTTITDIDTGRVVDLNEAAARWFGVPREEAIRMTTIDAQLWADPVDRARLRQEIQEQGEIVDRPFRLRKHSGEVREMSFSSKILEIGGRKYLLSCAHDITERRQEEEKLKQSLSLLKATLQSTADGLLVVDSNGKIADFNEQFAKLWGIPKSVLDLHDDQEALDFVLDQLKNPEQFIAKVRELYAHPEDTSCDVLEFKDGRVFERYSQAQRIDGKPAGRVWSFRDVTERTHAQEELKASEEKYKFLVETTNTGYVIIDGEGKVVDANAEYIRMSGHGRLDEIRGRSVVEWTTAYDQARNAENVKKCFASGGVRNLEIDYVGKHGRITSVEINANIISSGDAVSIFTLCRDITDRKRAEEKIRLNEQFIRSILDTVDEGFLVIDKDYRILTANKAYCNQVARPCNEVIGKHCFEISHDISRPCYEEGEECVVRQVFATGQPYQAVHTHEDPEGNNIFMETKGFPVKDAVGNVTSVIETINNITERRLLEEERLKTQKLESIGTLAGGIAHDFNNLLQGIFGYISMAKMTLGQREKSQAMLEEAEKALHQSVNLTTQLLTFSKGGKPVKKLIDLRPIIENSAKFTLSGSRSDFRLNIPEDLWQAEADEGQLTQVIQNIVLNADQAMPVGGTVMVFAANIAEGDPSLPPGLAAGDYVVIAVQDTGVGIPEQYLGKIFDPYFTTKEKGSGLGLATSYSIIRNHNGMIDVRTKSGEGSTFMIYLPAVAGKAGVETAAGPAKRPFSRTARVLVMDDEALIRNLSGELLRTLGHTLEVAKNGQEALEKYRGAMKAGKPFDIVILDLTVKGGMGGAETIQKILEIDPAVKAIVSTGYSDDAAMATYELQGFKGFLKKPYNIDDLSEVLSNLLTL